MERFHIGDRVELIEDSPDGNDNLTSGALGTVVWSPEDDKEHTPYDVNDEERIIYVQWDSYCEGHDCVSRAKEGHGWNVSACALKNVTVEEKLEFDEADFSGFLSAYGVLNDVC